jgi:menaquinone-dependent protoporphyrinogen oxidase
MTEIPVFYATNEGQTRRIAERISEILRERGFESAAIDVASPAAERVSWERVGGAILGASLHFGRHQKAAARFARTHRDRLNALPSAFFSVSLSIASKRPHEPDEARRIARSFAEEVGFRPGRIVCFPGRLAYTEYRFLVRFIMKRIARREGGPTDTNRDHELTDWNEVARFALDFARALRPMSQSAVARPAVLLH